MIDPDAYADLHYNAAHDYADQVERKKINTNKWIKLAVKRFRKDLKRKSLEQDIDKVKIVFKFFSLLNIQIKDQPRQFELHPYQAFIILNLFLFYYRRTGKRRFTSMFLFIGRKNGKTVFAVALNLYFMVLDGVMNPQSLLLASTKEQATVALDYAKSIVIESPALSSRLRPMQYEIKFKSKRSVGFMKPLPSLDPKVIDAYSPSVGILDEVHTYEDSRIYDAVSSGVGARQNPMVLMISTAGFIVDSFCNAMVENCQAILRGEARDDNMFIMLFSLDEDDDHEDPANWDKSNPGLGKILTMEYLKSQFQKAQNMPSLMPNFLTKHLNIFTGGPAIWIPEDVLKRGTSVPFKLEDFEGEEVCLGIDLSSTRDLASLNLLFHRDEMFYSYPIFWIPDRSDKLIRKGGVNLKGWIHEGLIIRCQTETLDYDMVYDKIVEIDQLFNIVALGYDPYNMDLLKPRLDAYGINMYKYPQTALAFNFPLKYIEKLIYEKQLTFGDNPCMLWQFRNIVLYIDGNNNIKIMKNRSKDSVDGPVALGMSMGGWLAYNLDPEKASIEAYLESIKTSE